MQEIIVCDLETTGLEPAVDKIIEVGLVKIKDGAITSTFETLINPGRDIPLKIQRLTGITNEMVSQSPSFKEVEKDITDFISGDFIAGHNIEFDASFLQQHFNINRNKKLDTLVLSRIMYPLSPGYRLEDICAYAGIKQNNKHRALSDALSTAKLAVKMIKRMEKLDLAYLIYMDKFLKQAGSPWCNFTTQLIKDKSRMQYESLNLRYRLFDLKEEKKIQEPEKENDEIIELDEEQVKSIFSAGGPLSSRLENFEPRAQQGEMAEDVARALNEKACLLAEAGTGTGKSLAYLVPLVMWAKKNKTRAVVATHTINLQEQLWNKDIPVIKQILDTKFNVALLKGKGNYLCLKRWESILNREENTWAEETLFFARILMWLKDTSTGDKNEINLTNQEKETWLQVCADTETCPGYNCSMFPRYCFWARSRRAAENATLIITNHSLLFTDMRSENRVLPYFGPLVIDEAHHLEDAATSHLGRVTSRSMLRRWLSSVYKASNMLSKIVPSHDTIHWQELLSTLKQERYKTAEQVNNLAGILGSVSRQGENNTVTFRIKKGQQLQQTLQLEINNILVGIRTIIKTIEEIMEFLDTLNNAGMDTSDYNQDLTELLTPGLTMENDLSFITSASDDNHVYWVEINLSTGHFSLNAAPIRVGELLHQNLFQSNYGIILTSATLTAGESFKYFMDRTGINLLPEDAVSCRLVNSPFEYENQCLLCIDNQLPVPGETDENTYYDRLAAALEEYITALSGRTMILFTSHYSLKEIYYRLKNRLEEMDILILGHNLDGNRSRLVEQFKTSSRAVLLGTASFWEGIDIPGPALANLIIARLPFWPPNMPVIEARVEELEKRGKSGFTHLSLPQAVIRLKQGFGRLIRSGRDKGAVIIADKRVVTKKYGNNFLRSLPVNNYMKGDTKTIKKEIINWLSEEETFTSN